MNNIDRDQLIALLEDAYTVVGEFLIDTEAIDASESGDNQYDRLIELHNKIAKVILT